MTGERDDSGASEATGPRSRDDVDTGEPDDLGEADTAVITAEPSTAEYEAAARASESAKREKWEQRRGGRGDSESGRSSTSTWSFLVDFLRVRRSTAILVVVFLALLVLYFWVRDDPVVSFDRPAGPEETMVEDPPPADDVTPTGEVTPTDDVTPTEEPQGQTTAPGQQPGDEGLDGQVPDDDTVPPGRQPGQQPDQQPGQQPDQQGDAEPTPDALDEQVPTT